MGKKILVMALAVAIVGVSAPAASAATMELKVAARWIGPSGMVPVTEGTVLDPTYNPYLRYDVAVRVSEGDNAGLAGVVFDSFCQQMADQGLYMWTYYDGESGYNNALYPQPTGSVPALQAITNPAYDVPQTSIAPAAYGGGWGFTGSGFPTGGVATAPGQVLNAGNSLPLIWAGDNVPFVAGVQSFARMGIGQGLNTGMPEDLTFAGTQLGRAAGPVPQDLANGVPGDGEYVMFTTFLNMAGMLVEDGKGAIKYTVSVAPTDGNWLMFEEDFTGDSVGLTYYNELQGGFRSGFGGGEMTGDSFSFYIPEPATVGLLLVGGLALVRRRR